MWFTTGTIVEVDASMLKQVGTVWMVEAGAHASDRSNPVQFVVNPASTADRVADV